MTALDASLTAPGLVERARWAVVDAVAVAGRDVAHWRRQPAAVLGGALFPVLLLLMFVYLLGGGMVVPGGGDYRDFLVPGMLALAMVFGVEATMTAVVTDTARGITDRFRSLPMAPSAVVAGRCLADMLSSVVGLVVLIAAASMPGWLSTIAEWNPVAGTVTAVRELFGSPVGAGGGWATEHALLLAVLWPVVLAAVFAVLSVRRFQGLSR